MIRSIFQIRISDLPTIIVSEWWSQNSNPGLSGQVPCSLFHYTTLPEVGRKEHTLEVMRATPTEQRRHMVSHLKLTHGQ